MSAALSEVPPTDGWTTDDLERFPEDNVRRELLDGVLLVSPSPSTAHQTIAGRLMVALEDFCPDDQVVTQNVDVTFADRRSFAPDVLVVTSTAAQRTQRPFTSHELILAVEIVLPTSVGIDRITKPAMYAQAGIPYYWRIETDRGIVVHTHKIDSLAEVYRPTGVFDDVIDSAEPWPVKIPIGTLRPRFM